MTKQMMNLRGLMLCYLFAMLGSQQIVGASNSTSPTSQSHSNATSPRPSAAPSMKPSNRTSDFPSDAPSDVPSSFVSDAPSDVPSGFPSSAPVVVSTPIPTAAPSALTTTAPVLPPGSQPISTTLQVELTMTGATGELVGPNEEAIFEGLVKMWFEGFYRNDTRRFNRWLSLRNLQASSASVSDVTTTYNITSQDFADNVNKIGMIQDISYVTADSSTTPEQVVTSPFQDQTSNYKLLTTLQSAFPVFSGVTSMSVANVAPPTAPPAEQESDKLSTIALIGIILGAVAFVCIMGICFYMMRRAAPGQGIGSVAGSTQSQRRREGAAVGAAAVGVTQSAASSKPPREIRGDDVDVPSVMTGPGESVATDEYTYSKAYRNDRDVEDAFLAGGASRASTRRTEDVPRTVEEEDMIDHVFRIYAPPGKLGVVIDTPGHSPPIVHSVKETSVIADQIQVGDKLISVDDEDVSRMSAIQVSKIISKKGLNPIRKLTLVRKVKKPVGQPADDLEEEYEA